MRYGIFTLSILILSVPFSAGAQDKSSVQVQATAGYRNAIIEGTCLGGGQITAGGALGYYFTPRVIVGPEVLLTRSCERQVFTFYHPQLSVMMRAAVDLNENSHIRPFLTGSGGFVRHRTFYSGSLYKAAVGGGAGSKFFLSTRVFVAPEIQVEVPVAALRITVSLGVRIR